MKPKVIFVPGLGDIKHGGLERLLKLSLGSLDVHYLPLIWSNGKFRPKLERMLAEIDKLSADGTKVSLLGTSAGASAVVNAYVQRRNKINKVILICGKLHERYDYRSPVFSANPAFKESMEQLKASLSKLTSEDKKKFYLMYSVGDRTVPPVDAVLDGANVIKLPRLRHVAAIIYALAFSANKIKIALGT